MNKISLTYGAIVILSLSAIFSGCTSKENKPTDAQVAANDSVIALIETVIKGINDRCPARIDEITTLDNCLLLDGKVFVYNYTIHDESLFELKQQGEAGIKQVKNKIKSTPALAGLRNHDITFRYIYKNKKGEIIYSFDVTPDDYK